MSDKQVKRFFKYLFRKIKAFLFTKDALIFLFFLLLSSTFWFVHVTNKNRETSIVVPIKYVDAPNDISIVNTPVSEIKLNIKDQGKNLFSYSKKRIYPLNIELSQATDEKGVIKFTSDQIHMRLTSVLRPTTSILSFSPDSIVVYYEKLASISLPIETNLTVEPAQQYILSDSIRIYPATITAFGKKEALDTFKSIKTVSKELKKVSESTTVTLPLIKPEGVNLSVSEIQAEVKVEMFTEKKMQLPVAFLNEPEGYTLKAFPASIDVTYNIAVSDYNTELDNIQLFVDYKSIKKNDQQKQKINITAASSKIFNIRLIPEEIEFILEEESANP